MRASHGVCIVLLGALGCRPEGGAVPAGATEPSESSALQADLSMLCERITAREISAWSQPVYRSNEVRDLTIQIDQGSEEARCELGKLMRAQRVSECRESAKNLREACKR